MSDEKTRIIHVLRDKKEPYDIESIRKEAGIGGWNTALRHLLELYIANEIRGLKTTKSWVFWVEDGGE